jgi:hypothetical protein
MGWQESGLVMPSFISIKRKKENMNKHYYLRIFNKKRDEMIPNTHSGSFRRVLSKFSRDKFKKGDCIFHIRVKYGKYKNCWNRFEDFDNAGVYDNYSDALYMLNAFNELDESDFEN